MMVSMCTLLFKVRPPTLVSSNISSHQSLLPNNKQPLEKVLKEIRTMKLRVKAQLKNSFTLKVKQMKF